MRKLFLILAGLAVVVAIAVYSSPTDATPDTTDDVVTVARHIDAIWPCAYFKPHTGDGNPFIADWNNESNPYVDTADCAVTHPTGGNHIFCVIEWHHTGDGTPINPPQYTWDPSGFC